MTHVGCVCAPHHRGRDIARRAGDIPEPVGDAPRHRPGMSPLVGDIPHPRRGRGDIPERPGISSTRPGMSPAAGDISPRRGVGEDTTRRNILPDFFWERSLPALGISPGGPGASPVTGSPKDRLVLLRTST
jgi:hypothetical protein